MHGLRIVAAISLWSLGAVPLSAQYDGAKAKGAKEISTIDFDSIPTNVEFLGATISLQGSTVVSGDFDVQGQMSLMGDVDISGRYFIGGLPALGLGPDGSRVLIGNSAGTGGFGSVFVGHLAGQDSITVSSDRNVFIGSEAGARNVTGRKNIYIGEEAGKENAGGSGNVMIGEDAGFSNQGDGNVFIGQEAGAAEVGSNRLYIANAQAATPLIYGEFDNQVLEINDVLRLAPRAAPPASPSQGTLYYDSSGALCVYNGGSWDVVGSGTCQ